ncbi:hypothetical protein Tco_0664819 [Tanacetum coccineum]
MGHVYMENVDYPELIWEDLAYQIDHRKEKRSRRENMPFPRFTEVIINYFLKQHNSLSNLKYQHYHIIKDDGIVCRLKFVRIGKNYQEYRLSIPETMLTEAIKQSESYQMFIKYSISQIPPKSRGKGLQRKNTAEDSQETVDVSKESEPKPESVTRKTSSKIALSADDNIIFDDPDTALELGKSISQTEAEEAEVARQSYKTLTTSNTKLKGAPSLTPEEQEAADIMQALKESKKTSKRQPGVPNEEKDITEENVILEWGSEQESEYSEEDKLGDEEKDDKNDDANDYYKIYVPNDEDEEMLNAKVDDSDKGDEEVTDAAKADTEKTSEVKDDAKKTKLPPSNCSLSVSSGFGDKFLKLSSDSSLLRVAKLEKDMSELKKIDLSVEALAYLKTQIPSVIDNYLGSKVGDVFKKELKKHTKNLIQKYSLQQIPKLPKKQTQTVDLEQESKKTPLEILMIKKEQTEKQKMPKFIINSTNKAALKEFDLKSALYPTKHANKSFNGNPTNHRLYHALMEALIEDENAMDKRVADIVKNHKKKHDEDEDDDDEDPLAGPNQGNLESVKSVSVKKLHVYGHLEEIMVKRADRQLFKFKEGNFVDLHLNDIEEILLLAIQHKLFYLTESDIVDFIVALQSYQKKLMITPPQQTIQKIEFKELYTSSHKPPRVIYEDLTKQKRVMRADELYKFLDGTLNKV